MMASRCYPAVVEVLAAGAEADAVNRGWTALMMASRGGYRAIVEVLLAAGLNMHDWEELKEGLRALYLRRLV